MRSVRRVQVTGEQLAQVARSDPFAPVAWRSPVYRTPAPVILLVQLARLVLRAAWFLIRHPLLTATVIGTGWLWAAWGWPAIAVLAATVAVVLAVLRVAWPPWFTRLVTQPTHDRWRWWRYRSRWHAVMTVTGLAPVLRGTPVVPVLGKVRAGRHADRVSVRLVSGQSPADFAAEAEGVAHGLGVLSCRVRTGPPGQVVLELVRRDALAVPVPAMPVPAVPDLRALPVGVREDGTVHTVRLAGTHLLIAGATGAGKGSWLWGLIRAMSPAMHAGLAEVHACDPKLMELAFGKELFGRFGRYAAGPESIADLLEADVAAMQERAARFAGKQRDHTATTDDPFVVVVVDEVAFLTAYQADRKLKDRTLAALTTQGRAAGYCVVAALQDPRKEVLGIRNLFPDKIALRLDEPSQADLVLGDGARDRGALCDQISADPATGAGVAYVRLETSPDPVRVRAAFVSDDDIRAMVTTLNSPVTDALPALALAPGEAA